MKKMLSLIFIIILVGSFSYVYFYKNYILYNTQLPIDYNNFEKDMFPVFIKINSQEKQLLINYSIRFKNKPSTITVQEALQIEKDFENTNEGIVFFSQLKEENIKKKLIEDINNAAFITFVDFYIENNQITIVFSIKNKSSFIINNISGIGSFTIANDTFTKSLDFNQVIHNNETIQLSKKFDFSQYPNLKDMSYHTVFKMHIKKIDFTNGKSLHIN